MDSISTVVGLLPGTVVRMTVVPTGLHLEQLRQVLGELELIYLVRAARLLGERVQVDFDGFIVLVVNVVDQLVEKQVKLLEFMMKVLILVGLLD